MAITKLCPPTSHFDKETKTFLFHMEQGQVRALFQANLQEDTEEARFGRELLNEIKKLYEEAVKKHGAIGIRIIPRKYDGEPV